MSFKIFKNIYDFNHQLIGIKPQMPLNKASIEWLGKVLNEEKDEFLASESEIGHIDALIDITIFAIGGLVRLGLDPKQIEQCFEAVMEANWKKKQGQKPGREVKGVKDAVKPDGWKGPEEKIEKIIKRIPRQEELFE